MESILKQDYHDIELIVVDDGSIDNSKIKIEGWNNKLQDLGIECKCISKKNGGPGSAINTGLKYVTGEYLSLLDIDDEYRENAISDRIKYLEEHKEVDVVRSDGYYVKNGRQWLFSTGVREMCIRDRGGIVTRLATRQARKQGTKVYYTAHGFHFYKGAPKKNWIIFYPIEKFFSRLTDKLITITQEDYELARRKFHCERCV